MTWKTGKGTSTQGSNYKEIKGPDNRLKSAAAGGHEVLILPELVPLGAEPPGLMSVVMFSFAKGALLNTVSISTT